MSLVYGQAEAVLALQGHDMGLQKVSLLKLMDPDHTDDAPVYCQLKIGHMNID